MQILHLLDAFLEGGSLEFRARVATGFFQFAENVLHRGQTEFFVRVFACLQGLDQTAIADHLGNTFLDVRQDTFDQRIGLRVHGGSIQRVIAAVDAQKAGRLLEGFVAQARHLA